MHITIPLPKKILISSSTKVEFHFNVDLQTLACGVLGSPFYKRRGGGSRGGQYDESSHIKVYRHKLQLTGRTPSTFMAV